MDRKDISASIAPWHDGELRLQRAAGVEEKMDSVGRRVLRDHLIAQHQEFYPLLAFIALGSVDANGRPWATLRCNRPGFLQARDSHHLHVDIARDPGDPAEQGLDDGDAVAILGIDLATRRRNRLNGFVRRSDDTAFDIAVGQAYGNCPQYIQLRQFAFVRDPSRRDASIAEVSESIDARARAIVAEADTFFVATYTDREDGQRQVDASHRGGKPGFVRVDDSGTLTIPDFAGNLFFNTLGNILLNGKAGLCFPNFVTGDLLQMSGEAEVVLDAPEIAAFQGAERLWRFQPRTVIFRAGALPLRWRFLEDGWSPNTLMTGSWEEAEGRLRASALRDAWRAFRIRAVKDENPFLRSFQLEPTDGAGTLPHQAGQHINVRVSLGNGAPPSVRTYTISSAPSDRLYRMSVKREGTVSRALHDTFKAGDLLEVQGPYGDFCIDPSEERPAVLLGGGVGITPLIAMVRHVAYEGVRKRRVRPIWLLHAAHSVDTLAFGEELRSLVSAGQGAIKVARVLSDPTSAVEGTDFELAGRVDAALLTRILPFNDYDFYLCGPQSFMQSLYDGLRQLNVADDRIHAEAFGPSRVTRSVAHTTPGVSSADEAEPAMVVFARSGIRARWTREHSSILDLAESAGLKPPSDCRYGSCGTCRTPLRRGTIHYVSRPSAAHQPDMILICCAQPSPGSQVELDL